MKDILVIGFSTRNIVCSGKRAGYNMFAIDVFCDHDMLACAEAAMKLDVGEGFFTRDIELSRICSMIDDFGIDFDGIIPASGFETMRFPEHLPVLGNDHVIMKEVSDKSRFAEMITAMDLPHPQTYSLSETGDLKYPVMVKPSCAGGGILNRVLHDRNELDSYLGSLDKLPVQIKKEDMIIQDYLSGIPASVSVISTRDEARTVAINEQLIGIPWLTELPFAYCGNITPLITPCADQMKDISERLIHELGLIGSNGVDFLITKNGPVVIEVNARFQGSLDTVEMSTGCNIFEAHMQAFDGILELKEPLNRQYASRAIIYGNCDTVITNDIQGRILEKNVVDVPNTGDVIHMNEPLTSVLSTGRSRDTVIREARSNVMFIREYINRYILSGKSPATKDSCVHDT
ncbi:MAG: ATP-grasp domain-containing protein [Methanosarcinaceae archaeon]|nr:ATP-grasp domain-containing protein [Methanosarcinaceae archaeon]